MVRSCILFLIFHLCNNDTVCFARIWTLQWIFEGWCMIIGGEEILHSQWPHSNAAFGFYLCIRDNSLDHFQGAVFYFLGGGQWSPHQPLGVSIPPLLALVGVRRAGSWHLKMIVIPSPFPDFGLKNALVSSSNKPTESRFVGFWPSRFVGHERGQCLLLLF